MPETSSTPNKSNTNVPKPPPLAGGETSGGGAGGSGGTSPLEQDVAAVGRADDECQKHVSQPTVHRAAPNHSRGGLQPTRSNVDARRKRRKRWTECEPQWTAATAKSRIFGQPAPSPPPDFVKFCVSMRRYHDH